MNICFLTREFYPFYYGGIGSHFYYQMKLLKEKGHNVFFVTHLYDNVDENVLQQLYAGINLIYTNKSKSNFSNHENLKNAFLISNAFDDFLLTNNITFDFVIAPDCAGESLFILYQQVIYGKYPSTKFIVEVEGPMSIVVKHNDDFEDKHFRVTELMEKFVLSNTHYFTFPTQIMKREVEELIGKPSYTFEIVPNLVNKEFESAQSLHISSPKNILFVGRYEYRKGVDLLLDAFIELSEEFPNLNANLFFAGRDQYWNKYQKTFFQYWSDQLSDEQFSKINFLDFLSHKNLKDCLEESWVSVFPSRWEPFGNVALEAMLSGCPVIVPTNTGLEEIVGSEYDLLFQCGDKNDLKIKLKKILNESLEQHIERSSISKSRALHVLAESDRLFWTLLDSISKNNDSLNYTIDHKLNSKLILEIFTIYNEFCSN
ncbi:MAG: hypothetical protein C0425_11585 [Chlorobiaceae bacterium]|nr:hypothetical protein [Chlorobiaceae bacterium]MBA4310956.1 hypothetical protein [Chlorobiaceae bacterium]